MKKWHIISTIVIIVLTVIAGITFFKRSPSSPFPSVDNLPKSKSHTHVSSTGKVIEHVHIYDPPAHQNDIPPPSQNNKTTEPPKTDYMKWNKVQRAWSQLDLAEIKRKWQPYTIAEMHEMWKAMETCNPEDFPNAYVSEGWDVVDKLYPRDEWLQRYMDLGHPFEASWHYRTALSNRFSLEKEKAAAKRSPEDGPFSGRENVFSLFDLPAEATWEELEDTFIKHHVLSVLAHDEYVRQNPDSEGGVFTIDGGFMPFKSDTVYVHVSEDSAVSKFIGPKMTKAEEDALTMFGIAPKGMKVVYTDKNGVPLPADVKPRFYERAMAQLKAAEQQVLQQIADHDALFNQTETATGQKTTSTTGKETQHMHTRPEDDEAPTHTVRGPQPPRKRPPIFDKNGQPPRPPEPQDPAQIEKWFEELILLHGGDLPKDLKALQKITQELKAIRREGEKKIPPKPTRSTSPETSAE